jgi:hypothetical protein
VSQTKQKTMHSVAIDRFGGPETLKVQTLPVPEGGPDETAAGQDSPAVPGSDTPVPVAASCRLAGFAQRASWQLAATKEDTRLLFPPLGLLFTSPLSASVP